MGGGDVVVGCSYRLKCCRVESEDVGVVCVRVGFGCMCVAAGCWTGGMDCDRVLLDIEARVVCVDGKGDGLIGMLSV